jgi:hypothetical protein
MDQVTGVKATGKFAGIHQISSWCLQTSGTITLARVDIFDVQKNILAAIGDSVLRLGAEQEVMLTGCYYKAAIPFARIYTGAL